MDKITASLLINYTPFTGSDRWVDFQKRKVTKRNEKQGSKVFVMLVSSTKKPILLRPLVKTHKSTYIS